MRLFVNGPITGINLLSAREKMAVQYTAMKQLLSVTKDGEYYDDVGMLANLCGSFQSVLISGIKLLKKVRPRYKSKIHYQ